MTADQPSTARRRSLFALVVGGTVAAATLTPAPAEAEPDDVIDGGTP